jgi:ATP-dependent DNA helicase RecQ
MFLSCLHSAVIKSGLYSNINLKPKQTKCLAAMYNRRDTVAVLPTGYGKSLIYQLLPPLLNERNLYEQRRSGEIVLSRSTPIILVLSPLNSLVDDQIRKINDSTCLKATILKKNYGELGAEPGIKDALFNIMYLHPEACLSSKAGFNLFQSVPYQNSVEAIVVDEAHCILE